MPDFNSLDSKHFILIKGAGMHNLKKIDVAIPRNNFVVITGLSGSGKSSLAFDTLYAEGQRRYVESLSSYARQFIGRMDKPDVEYIHGIAPAIAIQQKVNSRNPRSTVGTSTEIYDYLKLLFARIGKTISPTSGNEVKKDNVKDIVDFILSNKNKRIIITSPIYQYSGRTVADELSSLQQKGFDRLFVNDAQKDIDEVLQELNSEVKPKAKKTAAKKTVTKATDSIVESIPVLIPGFNLLIDRVVVGEEVDDDLLARLSDSAQIAFNEGRGVCRLYILEEDKVVAKEFSNRFEADGIIFEEPSVHLFSFNNPFGACKTCEGFGSVIGVDEDLVIPDKSLSIYDGAILCWRGEKLKDWNDKLVMNAHKFDFPIHKPYYELADSDKKLLWTGNKYFNGLNQFFEHLESQMYKIQYRVMLARYRGKKACPDCRGTRLRKDANYVKVGGKSISDIVLMPVDEAFTFFNSLKFEKHDEQIGNRLLTEINSRLQFLFDVGLGYLTLNRLSNSLSGGESQRINLATSLGSTLVGSMYILDEPSIGLHSRDTERLI
ncbi:MAG: excinuclease subunit UvrA, partial [Bacteroidota bacterium]